MNAMIMSRHSNPSAADDAGSRREEDSGLRRARQIRRPQASRTTLAAFCAALIATLLVLAALHTIVIVADAVQCLISSHEAMLQNGEPENQQLP